MQDRFGNFNYYKVIGVRTEDKLTATGYPETSAHRAATCAVKGNDVTQTNDKYLKEGDYAASLTTVGETVLWLDGEKRLNFVASRDSRALNILKGDAASTENDLIHLTAVKSHENAAALRDLLPNLKPVPLSLATSAGFGDRLGIATPGHVLALHRVDSTIAPIFAQQSIREMTRTKRTPAEVMTDASWGAFQAGWRGVIGADADHLKTLDDIDACATAGFSFYTVDPGEFVNDGAETADAAELRDAFDTLCPGTPSRPPPQTSCVFIKAASVSRPKA